MYSIASSCLVPIFKTTWITHSSIGLLSWLGIFRVSKGWKKQKKETILCCFIVYLFELVNKWIAYSYDPSFLQYLMLSRVRLWTYLKLYISFDNFQFCSEVAHWAATVAWCHAQIWCWSIPLLIQLGSVHSKQILKVTCQGNIRVRYSSMVWRTGVTIIKTTILDLSNGTYVNHLHTWKRARSRLWMGWYLEGKNYLTFPDPPLKQNKEPAQIRSE